MTCDCNACKLVQYFAFNHVDRPLFLRLTVEQFYLVREIDNRRRSNQGARLMDSFAYYTLDRQGCRYKTWPSAGKTQTATPRLEYCLD